jgi:hypothetical protein
MSEAAIAFPALSPYLESGQCRDEKAIAKYLSNLENISKQN